MDDPFEKLRPPPPTPEDEICSCGPGIPIKLMCALRYNPIACMACNLERRPEALGLDALLVQAAAYWRSIYDSVYVLWLDSAEYEEWARAQLVDLRSPVNLRGRELQVQLNRLARCYYWLFQDASADDYVPHSACPDCGQPWEPCRHRASQLICDRCSLVTT